MPHDRSLDDATNCFKASEEIIEASVLQAINLVREFCNRRISEVYAVRSG